MTQLSLTDGLARKAEGQDSAESHDEAFVDSMRRIAQFLSQKRGMVSTDDLRILAEALGLTPRHSNVWGAIFRGPEWQVVGRKKSAVPANHAREIRIWRYVA